MAGDSDKTKIVYFIGAWRTQQVSDQLLRQITNQITSKKKVATKLSILAEGLELLILNSNGQVTRKDKIALENIVDFINNKYCPTCTLAIVRDKQRKQYTVFVFQCRSDRDAASLIQNFKTTKQQLSGEGYNTNLTPKGKNWTLQQKSERTALNGDVRGRPGIAAGNVTVINAEKQNGGVTVIDTAERHDSISRESIKTSNSEVKEELHHLADEVRDIKRLLQGSKGRTQFEKHYGYRIFQAPPISEMQRQPEYIEREVNVRAPEVKRSNLYVKNEANTRYVEAAAPVLRVGNGVARSTRRYKTKGHFVTATSPTRAEYTKRVYDSTNPLLENGQQIQSVKVVTRNAPSVLLPRSRVYQTQSSDTVQKNIEDVYRSRSLRKIYLPPSTNGNTVEYVNSQMVQRLRPVPQKPLETRELQQNTVHVKYSPEVRTYYDTTAADTSVESKTSNESVRQIDDSFGVQQYDSVTDRNDNVIVVKTAAENYQNSTEERKQQVVYVKDDYESQQSEPEIIGGNIYHVRAEFREDFEKHNTEDENVTIIHTSEIRAENKEDDEETDNTETADRAVAFRDRTIDKKDDQDNIGLFGAYVKRPEDYDEPRDEVTAETSFRYNEDEFEIEESTVEKLQSQNENGGLFEAYTKAPQEDGDRRYEVVQEAAVRNHENEMKLTENEIDEQEQPVIQDIPDSFEEKRVRYNEIVEEIPMVSNRSAETVESVHVTNVYSAESQQGHEEEFRNELSSVVSKIRHNYDEKIKEENAFDADTKESDEKYEFDMSALQAYSVEPDIVIVESNNEKTIDTAIFENDTVIDPEDEPSQFDDVKRTISDKRDSIENAKMGVLEEIRNRSEKLDYTKDEILEITSKTENTVLF